MIRFRVKIKIDDDDDDDDDDAVWGGGGGGGTGGIRCIMGDVQVANKRLTERR